MNIIVTKKYTVGKDTVWIQTKMVGRAVAIRRVLVDLFDFPSEASQWENYFPRKEEGKWLYTNILGRIDYTGTKWSPVIGKKLVEGVSPPLKIQGKPRVLGLAYTYPN